jgi:hypothetical protein
MPEWSGAFADFAATHPGCGQPIVEVAYLPPDWSRAFQYSRSTVLVWDGMVFACPEPLAPPPEPAPTLFFEDWDYVDVGPWLVAYAARHRIPIQGLIGLIDAECKFNTHATRYGVWPDVSAGYSQMTVSTAAGYGIGNGSSSDANIEYVMGVLQDRETGISLAAQHYAMCLGVVDGMHPAPLGDERLIMGLRAYNGGTGYGLTDHYANKYPSHIASYRYSLELAYSVLRGKNYPPDPV